MRGEVYLSLLYLTLERLLPSAAVFRAAALCEGLDEAFAPANLSAAALALLPASDLATRRLRRRTVDRAVFVFRRMMIIATLFAIAKTTITSRKFISWVFFRSFNYMIRTIDDSNLESPLDLFI